MASTAQAEVQQTGGSTAPAAPAELQRFLDQFYGGRIALPDEPLTTPVTGTVGRDLGAERPAFNIIGGGLAADVVRPFKVVSFYTEHNGYDVHAARLRESLEAFGVPYEIEPVGGAGWESICALKSQFLLDKWRASDIPIVWLDADAVVEQAPALFAAIEADFAAHKWDWEPGREEFGYELCSGTLYFGKTALAERLLEQWAMRCAADPATWDQRHLQSAWCDVSAISPLRTLWLPRAYLQIDGAPELTPPVIRHLQASREEGARSGRAPIPQFAVSPMAMEDRRCNRLWRSPEQAFWISEGDRHIIPAVGHEFPEGFDVGAALTRAIGVQGGVLEFGCGVGRIAALFEPSRYLGVDINPHAIAAARQRLPGHRLRVWDDGEAPPATDAVLFYTVLLHVSDAALAKLLVTLCHGRKRVVIAELMDLRWRRGGDPPVFNRDPETYILAMQRLGYDLVRHEKQAYARYDNPQTRAERDVRISFLTFDVRTARG